MKKVNLLPALLITMLLFNCNKNNDSDSENEIEELETGIIEVAEELVSQTMADVEWNAVAPENGGEVVYDIFLEGDLVKANNPDTDYSFVGLESATRYEGEIVAKELSESTSKSENNTDQKQEETVIDTFSFELTTKVFSNPNAPEPNIVNFSRTLGTTTISLEWELATLADGSEISVAVYLEGNLLANNLEDTNYTITGLIPDTEYEGSVVAISSNQKTSARLFTYTTFAVDSPPGEFTISAAEITATSAQISWSQPAENGAEIAGYKLFLNDQQVGADIEANAEKLYALENLAPKTEYTVTVEAFTDTNLTNSSEVIFTTSETSADEPIGDFGPVSINNLFPTARLIWFKPETFEDMAVTYTITLDGTALTDDFDGGDNLLIEYFLNDLTPETAYSGTVEARTTSGATRTEDFSFTTVRDISDEPIWAITVASEIESNTAQLIWQMSSVPEGVTFTYDIVLIDVVTGNEVTAVTDYDGGDGRNPAYTFTDLAAGEYQATLTAKASDGSSKDVVITFLIE